MPASLNTWGMIFSATLWLISILRSKGTASQRALSSRLFGSGATSNMTLAGAAFSDFLLNLTSLPMRSSSALAASRDPVGISKLPLRTRAPGTRVASMASSSLDRSPFFSVVGSAVTGAGAPATRPRGLTGTAEWRGPSRTTAAWLLPKGAM